jgi:tripartite ATP-independent transporter DctP family solute receptor
MKASKKFLVIGMALLMAFSATQAFGQAFKPKAEYTMQVNVGPLYDWGVGAQLWADLVKQRTNGQINIKPYFGSSLLAGKQTNWYQSVADGAVDFVVDSTINASTVVKSLNLFTLPFLMPSYEAADKIKAGKAGELIIKDFERGGVKHLAWGENGFRQVTNSKRPITSPADMKGLKFRVAATMGIDAFKMLGADAVFMNWGDAVTGFQQGVVDGQENPKSVLTVVKIWEYHKYITNWYYVLDPLVFGVNNSLFKKFPADIQKIIWDSAKEAAEIQIALARAYLDGDKSVNFLKTKGYTPVDAYETAKKAGMIVTELTPAQIQVFKDALQPMYDKWVPIIGKNIYEAALADMKK